MKRLIILSILMLSSSAFSTVYLVEDGDVFGVRILVDHDTFLMTGGGGDTLSLLEWSTGTIENTTPLTVPLETGIWQISVSAYSELTIEGGEIQFITTDDFSTLNLYGGQILGDLMVEDLTAWVHIFGYGFNNDPFLGSPLTGFWADDTPFSINLVDSTISTYDQIIFHEIPEPATMLLLGLGGLMLRRKRA